MSPHCDEMTLMVTDCRDNHAADVTGNIFLPLLRVRSKRLRAASQFTGNPFFGSHHQWLTD